MMDESSACLMGSSEETKENNPINQALTSSVSFGRFMSESLDWGKWSAFTHNRHLEEVERYSKPGSVAEKKAYFEAHYKRRRAAALLKQQNVSATDLSLTNVTNTVEDNSSLVSELVTESIEEREVPNDEVVEAQYKRRRSAALLEQQNVSATDFSLTNGTEKLKDNSLLVSELATENMEEEKVQNCDIVHSFGDQKAICDDEVVEAQYKRRRSAALLKHQNVSATDFSQTNGTQKLKDNYMLVSEMAIENMEEVNVTEVVEQVTELSDLKENTLESVNNKVIEGVIVDTLSSQENEESFSTMKSSDSNLMKSKEFKKSPLVKPVVPFQTRNSENKNAKPTPPVLPSKIAKSRLIRTASVEKSEKGTLPRTSTKVQTLCTNFTKTCSTSGNKAPSGSVSTSSNMKNGKASSNKRKLNSTSLHMSINYGETQKTTSPGLPLKISNSKLIKATSVEKSEIKTLPQTSTMVRSLCTNFTKTSSTCGSKVPSTSVSNLGDRSNAKVTSNKRKLNSTSLPRTSTKVQSLSTNFSKTSNTCESKAPPLPSVSTSFIFKSEERVAKRKEFYQKLEQKKSHESEKLPNVKPQFKARSDLKDHLKATKSAEVPLTIKSPNKLMKKPPKIQEREALKVQDNESRPPWRFSTKPSSESLKDFVVKGKNNNIHPSPPPLYSRKSSSKKSKSENVSPNIKT